nr:integrase, catalytic region, zinc finger, CCHC-type, peptidase aspartic, catalytic [Tanacetum cinerariifolium]
MTGNLKLLTNFVEKFLGSVKFGNDQIAPILSYGDLVQGTVTIKRVYYVEGLNHNLFSAGQFCDADLEVAFWKSTCYICDLMGNDLLTVSHGTNLYFITLQDTSSPNPICLMAKVTSSQAWLWHRRLSHLKFDTINLISKNDWIHHQTSVARTPEQNGVVEKRNRTLVKAARIMLSAAKVPLFFWAEAIATTCFTHNRSLVKGKQEKDKIRTKQDKNGKLIEFGDSYKVPATIDPNDTNTTSGADAKSGRTVTITTEDMQRKKNDVKARTTLLLSLLDEHQLRFNKYKAAKELWAAILKTFGVVKKDDLNQKFLTSLAPEWLMHTIVWRNRNDLDTMSLDDLYNHLKHSIGDEDGNTACVSTASTTFPTASASVAREGVLKKLEEKRIEEEQAAKAPNLKIPACADDDDDYSAITPNEPVDSLSMGDEHLNTIPATESDEFIKSCVENLVPNPSESKGENGCDSCSDEDVLEKIFSNPLFEEEIISTKIDPHHFDAESDLIESMLNRDSSIISSSSKIDSFLDEFSGELTLLKSIPPGIDKTDCYSEEDIHIIEILLYDNSSPRPLEEFVSENSDADIESFSPSPIPDEDNDSRMEEIDLSFNPDDLVTPSIKDDDDDSKRDIIIREELLDNYSLSLPVIESFCFDIPSFSRPPAKRPDGNTGILNIKIRGDIFDQK